MCDFRFYPIPSHPCGRVGGRVDGVEMVETPSTARDTGGQGLFQIQLRSQRSVRLVQAEMYKKDSDSLERDGRPDDAPYR